MANTPTPRSYGQILGDMLDAFLSKKGIRAIKRGSPILSILEAASQSDTRNAQDIFEMLSSVSLDTATGVALQRIGLSEDTPLLVQAPSTGYTTFSDTSFEKITTTIHLGYPAPITGSTQIRVSDGSLFPDSGSIYLGRGTTNYEGPLAYTKDPVIPNAFNLAPTVRFHNVGESVILAQGGNRIVRSGTVVQTQQGNRAEAIQYTTLFDATLPDGEVEIKSVMVACRRPGVIGNVPRGAINKVETIPFAGISVTNPLPFTNGRNTEQDDEYRERIRQVRKSRSKGTPTAIKTATLGLTAYDEASTITSVSLLRRASGALTLIIDDGTGYEEKTYGISIETLTERAWGGEKYFQIASTRPVSKAYLQSTRSAPYNIQELSTLSIEVGGTLYVHTFDVSKFRSHHNATAYEIVSDVNGNPDITFGARTAEGGTKVVLFARTDDNEDLQAISTDTNDANDELGFPLVHTETIHLYKNDVLLSKDGSQAEVTSGWPSQWTPPTDGDTLIMAVDQTSAATYTFVDADFVQANTGYVSVGMADLETWKIVLEQKIPGISIAIRQGTLVMTSNKGRSSDSRISIEGGTLVDKGMWALDESNGEDLDYIMDRGWGMIELATPLVEGDRLVIGSIYTRPFIESDDNVTVTLAADANLWFVVDGEAQIVPHGAVTGQIIAADITAPVGLDWLRVVFTLNGAFVNVEVGDRVILWDGNIDPALHNTWTIHTCDADSITFDIPPVVAVSSPNYTLVENGVAIVRSTEIPTQVVVPAGDQNASTLSTIISEALRGGTGQAYRTNRLRVRSNTFDAGDIALVACDDTGLALGLGVSDAVEGGAGHLGSIPSKASDVGAPYFDVPFAASVVQGIAGNTIEADNPLVTDPTGRQFVARSFAVRDGVQSFSSWAPFVSTVIDADLVADEFTVRDDLPAATSDDQFYFASHLAVGPEDDLSIVVDGDPLTRRYTPSMYRSLETVGAYGATSVFSDAETGGSLEDSFAGHDWNDYAVYMHARGKSHVGSLTSEILWRAARMGKEGESFRVRYAYALEPDADVAVTVDASGEVHPGETRIDVHLPSGAELFDGLRRDLEGYISIYNPPPHAVGGFAPTVTIFWGYAVQQAEGVDLGGGNHVTRLTVGTIVPALELGQTVYFTSDDPTFPSGRYTLLEFDSVPLNGTIDISLDVGVVAPTAIVGGLTFGDVPVDVELDLAVGVGDIVVFPDSTSTNLPRWLLGRSVSIEGFTATHGRRGVNARIDPGAFGAGLPNDDSGYSLGDLPELLFFEPGSITAALLVDAVNALDDSPVTVALLGDGTGLLDTSGEDESPGDLTGSRIALNDGLNYVQSHGVSVGDTSFTFALTPTAELVVAPNDWEHENVRVVPCRTRSVCDWLMSPRVCGLYSVGAAEPAHAGRRIQLSSSTPGDMGSVQVQGGLANDLVAQVLGSPRLSWIDPATDEDGYCTVQIPTEAARGLRGDMAVMARNTKLMTRDVFDATTEVAVVGNTFDFSSGGTPPITVNGYFDDAVMAAAVAVPNRGPFRIQHAETVVDGFDSIIALWLEDQGQVEQDDTGDGVVAIVGDGWVLQVFAGLDVDHIDADPVAGDWLYVDGTTVYFLDNDSVLPGDTITVNSDVLGDENQGTWTVQSITVPDQVVVDGTPVGNPMVVLADNANQLVCREHTYSRLLKRIQSLVARPDYPELSWAVLDNHRGYRHLSAAAGTVLDAVDKLQFPAGVFRGRDAYRRTTGLLGEAAQVLFGNEANSAKYPGVVAAGAVVGLSGPSVKRVSIALTLRIRTGVRAGRVAEEVKSAVAAVVNESGVGEHVAISDIVCAATNVPGVLAVSVTAPTYTTENDMIPVQPHEKMMVLDVDGDIEVSFIGD